MKNIIKKPYGNIYFEKNLPTDCAGCPFNYDTISCLALDYDNRSDKLTKYLDYDIKGRYYFCPLRLLKKEKNNGNN